MTYFCFHCGTTHSRYHPFYEEHKKFAVYFEEFNYPTVKQMREIVRQLKQIATQLALSLSKQESGHYEIYVSSKSFKNILIAVLKSRVKGKPVFKQTNDTLENKNLGLKFTFLPKKEPGMDCIRIGNFEVCLKRVGVLKRPKEEKILKEVESKIIPDIRSMLVFLWSVGVTPLTIQEYAIYKKVVDKIKYQRELSPKSYQYLKNLQKVLKSMCYKNSKFNEVVENLIYSHDYYRNDILTLSKTHPIKKVLRAFARKLYYMGIKDINELLNYLGFTPQEICQIFSEEVAKIYRRQCNLKVVFALLIEPKPF